MVYFLIEVLVWLEGDIEFLRVSSCMEKTFLDLTIL